MSTEIRSSPKSEPKGSAIRKAWDETARYFKGVRAEFKRVTWPTRQELRNNTIVVVVLVALISTYMWGVDQVLNLIFRLLHRT